jgi:hypothetical protein
MMISHKVKENIANKICNEMLDAWPSCINPDKMRSIIKEAAMLAIHDFIELNIENGHIDPKEYYESV